MASDLVTVCIFGSQKFDIVLSYMAPFEAKEFDCHFYDTDDNIQQILVEHRPKVIVTIGDAKTFHKIWQLPLEMRKRWIHYDSSSAPNIAFGIMNCYVCNATEKRFPEQPLVSVFTPTYKTGDKIQRPFKSLLEQSYTNWEWVIYDDSPDDSKTFNEMCELAKQDHRISVYRSATHSGVIGNVKHNACMVSKGSILVELDHDDELTVDGLFYVVKAFQQFPDAGFAYTDCAEMFDNGQNASYGPGWGFGYGSYRDEYYKGKLRYVTNYPNVNSKTIRHIVAAPNHIRAWTKDAYIAIGGHGRDIHVCDDYELVIRTFLNTRMIKIPKLGYIQYYNQSTTGNTQRKRNAEIQRLVKFFREKYNDAIHKRFVELDVNDFVWSEKGINWDVPNPEPEPITNYVAKF